jgi:hypothetical protein
MKSAKNLLNLAICRHRVVKELNIPSLIDMMAVKRILGKNRICSGIARSFALLILIIYPLQASRRYPQHKGAYDVSAPRLSIRIL